MFEFVHDAWDYLWPGWLDVLMIFMMFCSQEVIDFRMGR